MRAIRRELSFLLVALTVLSALPTNALAEGFKNQKVKEISSASAIMEDGSCFVWGDNSYGCLPEKEDEYAGIWQDGVWYNTNEYKYVSLVDDSFLWVDGDGKAYARGYTDTDSSSGEWSLVTKFITDNAKKIVGSLYMKTIAVHKDNGTIEGYKHDGTEYTVKNLSGIKDISYVNQWMNKNLWALTNAGDLYLCKQNVEGEYIAEKTIGGVNQLVHVDEPGAIFPVSYRSITYINSENKLVTFYASDSSTVELSDNATAACGGKYDPISDIENYYVLNQNKELAHITIDAGDITKNKVATNIDSITAGRGRNSCVALDAQGNVTVYNDTIANNKLDYFGNLPLPIITNGQPLKSKMDLNKSINVTKREAVIDIENSRVTIDFEWEPVDGAVEYVIESYDEPTQRVSNNSIQIVTSLRSINAYHITAIDAKNFGIAKTTMRGDYDDSDIMQKIIDASQPGETIVLQHGLDYNSFRRPLNINKDINLNLNSAAMRAENWENVDLINISANGKLNLTGNGYISGKINNFGELRIGDNVSVNVRVDSVHGPTYVINNQGKFIAEHCAINGISYTDTASIPVISSETLVNGPAKSAIQYKNLTYGSFRLAEDGNQYVSTDAESITHAVPDLEGQSYYYTVDGEKVIITKYSGGNKNITIREDLGGYVPTEIASGTFENLHDIDIIVPATIKTISPTALKNCTNVTIKTNQPDTTPDVPTTGGGGASIPVENPNQPVTKDGASTVTKEVAANVTDKKAVASVTEKTIVDLIESIKKVAEQEKASANIELTISSEAAFNNLELKISQGGIKSLADSNIDTFSIKSDAANVVFNAKAISEISNQMKTDVTLCISKLEDGTLDITLKNGNSLISDFKNGKVIVEIPYEAADKANAYSVVAYQIIGDGTKEMQRGIYDAKTKLMAFSTNHFSKYLVTQNNIVFSDVNGEWFADAVTFAAARNIVGGVGNQQFAPNKNVTRAQVVKMLCDAYPVKNVDDSISNFSDAGDTWYTEYLLKAKQAGLISGTGENQFEPEREITREEAFVMIYNALEKLNLIETEIKTQSVSFNDQHDISPWANDAVQYFSDKKIINGDNNNISPQAQMKRSEIVQVFLKLTSSEVAH